MSRPTAPHVVMVVANDVGRDTRVKKEALALARAGLRVTVVGHAPDGDAAELAFGPVRLIRVPVSFTVRDAARTRRTRRRNKRPPIGYRTAHEAKAARLVWSSRIREAGARRPVPVWRSLQVLFFKVMRRRVALSTAAQLRVHNRMLAAWKKHDERQRNRTRGVRWRRELPEMRDWERAFGPVLEGLAPDAIHAHDVHLLGVAAQSTLRLRRAGRAVRFVYDSHEFVQGEPVYGHYSPRFIAAHADLEREAIALADRVITVSPQIATALQKSYGLPRTPSVVLNAPTLTTWPKNGPSVRRAAGVGKDTPLMVYSGNLTPVRGIEAMIDALALMPGVHLALVVPHIINNYGQSLLDRATEAGTADRLHVVPAVDSDQVSQYLSTATFGVHGLARAPSHDMALPNKLFEYLQARLPHVVSDVPAMAEFVREHGIGDVYVTGDSADLAKAALRVLENIAELRSAFDEPGFVERFSWEPQADVLRSVYADLLGPLDELGPDLPMTIVPVEPA